MAENQYPDVRGPIAVNPRYRVLTNSTIPVEYLVLLDASGSMSYNYAGEGTVGGTAKVDGDTVGGTDYRCQYNSMSTLPGNDQCQGGLNAAWHSYQERRIYRAKAKISKLIDDLAPNDAMRIVAFSTSVGPDHYAALPASGWSFDKTTLHTVLRSAGSFNGDPYRTQGGSTNAQAMQGAAIVLNTAPPIAPNGAAYHQVMIVIADGPANVFLNGVTNNARDICANLTTTAALSSVKCQVGFSDTTKQLRPVSAMIDQANQIKNNHPSINIYTINAEQIETGLNNVASSASMSYTIVDPASIDSIVTASTVSHSTCSRAGGSQYVTTIDAAHAPESLPEGVYGYASLFTSSGTTLLTRVPITHDQVSGELSYRFDALPPGDYQVSADVAYRGDDGVTRHYDSLSTNKFSFSTRLPFSVVGTSAGEVIEPIVYADLAPTVDVCAP